MDDTLITALLDECARHSEQVKSIEPYLNNEPFLDPRFLDVLRGIRSRLRCNVEVSTNASVLDGRIVRAVLDERLIDDFRISVFGATEQTYEAIMVRLRWERVLANIEHYRQQWLGQGRPNRTRIVFVHNPRLHPPDEVQRVRDLWAQSGFELIVWEQLDRAGNNRVRLHRPRRGQIIGCKGGYMRDRVVIMFNGDVLLCCQDWSRQTVIGRVGPRSLEEVWNSPERRAIADAIYSSSGTTPDLCSRCEMAKIESDPASPAQREGSLLE